MLMLGDKLNAGVSDHLAREAKLKHFEGNTVSTISEYANMAYLVELIALGLVAAALLAVTFSIITRRSAGKKEHETLLTLRRSAEQDKKIFDATVSEINNIGKKVKEETAEVQEQITLTVEKAAEAEQRAENIATLELEMKQLVDGTTERMSHIQEYWDKQLESTVETINQINEKLDNGIHASLDSNQQAEHILKALSERMEQTPHSSQEGIAVNGEIKEILDQTLEESRQLLSQIRNYQTEAESVFNSFRSTMGDVETQAHQQFDEVFNAADIARQELNANLDESREYIEVLRNTEKPQNTLVLEGIDPAPNKPKKQAMSRPERTKKPAEKTAEADQAINVKGRHGRPIIGMNDAEDLTDPSLIKAYGKDLSETEAAEDKNLVSLFSKFRQHGS